MEKEDEDEDEEEESGARSDTSVKYTKMFFQNFDFLQSMYQ